jgi:hypothetical protein
MTHLLLTRCASVLQPLLPVTWLQPGPQGVKVQVVGGVLSLHVTV